MSFSLQSEYQPRAISRLSDNIISGVKHNWFLEKHYLVISHNRTLAGTYQEFKQLFLDNKFPILFLTMIIINPILKLLLYFIINYGCFKSFFGSSAALLANPTIPKPEKPLSAILTSTSASTPCNPTLAIDKTFCSN